MHGALNQLSSTLTGPVLAMDDVPRDPRYQDARNAGRRCPVGACALDILSAAQVGGWELDVLRVSLDVGFLWIFDLKQGK